MSGVDGDVEDTVLVKQIDCRLDCGHGGLTHGGNGFVAAGKPTEVEDHAISAFRRCSNLSEVIIASAATFIKDGAFAECADITSLSLPNGISIAGSAFSIDILHTGTEIRFYNPKDGSIDEPETTENDLPF